MRPGVRRKILLLLLIVAPVILALAYLSPVINDPFNTDRHPEAKSSPRERTPDHLRVLFIGNSFTFANGGLPLSLQRLVDSARVSDGSIKPIIAERVTYAGASLEELWGYGEARARIGEGNWDYVVLQDHSRQSLTPTDRAKMFSAISRFDQEIKKTGARTLLFMTWALRNHPEDQTLITAAYNEAGRAIGARVISVGLAWREAMRQRPDMNLYAIDDKHPAPRGSYLTACLFYAAIYGRNPAGLTDTVADRNIKFIQLPEIECAWLANLAAAMVGLPSPATEPALPKSTTRTPSIFNAVPWSRLANGAGTIL